MSLFAWVTGRESGVRFGGVALDLIDTGADGDDAEEDVTDDRTFPSEASPRAAARGITSDDDAEARPLPYNR